MMNEKHWTSFICKTAGLVKAIIMAATRPTVTRSNADTATPHGKSATLWCPKTPTVCADTAGSNASPAISISTATAEATQKNSRRAPDAKSILTKKLDCDAVPQNVT